MFGIYVIPKHSGLCFYVPMRFKKDAGSVKPIFTKNFNFIDYKFRKQKCFITYCSVMKLYSIAMGPH